MLWDGFHYFILSKFHPLPICDLCAQNLLMAISLMRWQCRTYFRRYGCDMVKVVVGVMPQQHDQERILDPSRGPGQVRVVGLEVVIQSWRMMLFLS